MFELETMQRLPALTMFTTSVKLFQACKHTHVLSCAQQQCTNNQHTWKMEPDGTVMPESNTSFQCVIVFLAVPVTKPSVAVTKYCINWL